MRRYSRPLPEVAIGLLLVRRLGRTRLLALVCGAQGLLLLTFSPLTLGHAPFLPTVVVLCLFGVAYPAGSVAISTITMDLTRPASAASDFTTLTGVGYFVSLAGGAVGAVIAGRIGYLPVIIGAAALMAAASANARAKDIPR